MLAQRLDPDGKDGYRTEAALRVLFAEQAKSEAMAQYRFAAKALKALVDLDPTEPELRFQLAETLFKADNQAEGRREAEAALRLDELVHERRKLSPSQSEQLHKRLAPGGQ
jgi:predicted Zn-dependent protease